MSTAITSALVRAREVLDRKRGQSNDSARTDDSPFGSSLATPVDADDIGITTAGASSSASSALRFLREDSSVVDYFGFKKGGPAFLSRALGLGTRKSSSMEQTPSTSRCTSAQISPGCSTPGSLDEETLMRKRSMYNLPNKPIEVQAWKLERSASDVSRAYIMQDDIAFHESYIGDDDWKGLSLDATAEDAIHDFSLDCVFDDGDGGHPLWFFRSVNFSSEVLVTSAVKVLCFVPWCIFVGGTILLWPDQLEMIAFQVGYVDSVQGIRRFAHWADVGLHFVMIFLAFLATVLWFLPRISGVTLVIGLCSRFVFVWHGCKIDYSVPLGMDDRQSLYLLAMIGERGLLEGSITKTDAGFVVIPS